MIKRAGSLVHGDVVLGGCGPPDGVRRTVYSLMDGGAMHALEGHESKRSVEIRYTNGDRSWSHPDACLRVVPSIFSVPLPWIVGLFLVAAIVMAFWGMR